MKLLFMTEPALCDKYQTFLMQEKINGISCFQEENIASDPPDDPSGTSTDLIVLCDTDDKIRQAKSKGSPVIAIAHSDNDRESLMGAAFLINSVEALTPDFLGMVMARHHRLPLQILETGRCRLRELVRADLPFLLQLQEENEGNPFASFFPPDCKDPKDYLDNYIACHYPFFGFGVYLILDKEKELPVGIAGYSLHEEVSGARLYRKELDRFIPLQIGENESVVEIGYCISRARQAQGLASEILPPLIHFGRNYFGFDRILAVTEKTNTASIRLAKKNQLEVVFLP